MHGHVDTPLVSMSLVRVAVAVVNVSESLFDIEVPLLRLGATVSLLNIGHDGRSRGGSCHGTRHDPLGAGYRCVWDTALTEHDNDLLLDVDDLLGVLVDLNRGGGGRGRR